MGTVSLLSDRRPIRAMEGSVNQMQMFQLRGKFNPQTEGVAGVRDTDDAWNVSRVYQTVMGNRWIRTNEYGVYHRDSSAPLGSEVVWVENGVHYKHSVPDIPVKFGGKEISLQKAVAMGVYDSIDSLKVEQTDERVFIVSVVDPTALTGRVRAVDFMRGGWALTDEHGYPLASQPASSDNGAARYGWARTDFAKGATGYHGSVARGVYDFGIGVRRRNVGAGGGWSGTSWVAIVGRSAAAPLEVGVPAVQGSPVELKLTREGGGRLVVEGTPTQLDAAVRLLQTLKE